MTKHIVYIACILSVFTLEVYSAPRNTEQVLEVAFKMRSHQASHGISWGKGVSARSALKIVKRSDSYYIVNTGDGFVIVSSDDQMPEILGFSPNGEFEENNMPPALSIWLRNYDSEFKGWRNFLQSHPSYNIENDLVDENPLDSIGPLLQTKWGQTTPYNNYCPIDCNGDTCPTGCVITALAQIMNHWQWPQKGFGEHTYVYVCHEDSAYTQLLSANFDTTMYHWENMQISYNIGDSAYDVALLMSHLGIAMEAHYAKDGTGLKDSEIRQNAFPALFSHFGYDSEVQIFAEDFCSKDSLALILHNELMQNRPIFVCGNDTSSKAGHAFVCDGYYDHFFHLNWGWDGFLDGWFRLSAFSPSFYNIINYYFTSYVTFYTGIQPNNRMAPIKYQGQTIVADSIKINSSTVIGESNIVVNMWGFTNVGLIKYQDYLGFGISPIESERFVQIIPFSVQGLEGIPFYTEGYADLTNVMVDIHKSLPAGQYKVEILYLDEERRWKSVPMSSKKKYAMFTKADGVKPEKPISIYAPSGQLVHYFETWDNMDDIYNLNLPRGTYIIQQGKEILKIVL